MKKLLGAITSSGFLLFVFSFFIPFGYYNSPCGRFFWAFERVITRERVSLLDRIVFLAVSVVICYPFVFAFFSALTAFLKKAKRIWIIHFVLNALGLGLVLLLGLGLLLSGDTFVPLKGQLLSIFLPPLVVFFIAFAKRRFGEKRGAYLVMAVIPTVFAVMGLLLAAAVFRDGGNPLGYLLGAFGAFLGSGGSFSLFVLERVEQRGVL